MTSHKRGPYFQHKRFLNRYARQNCLETPKIPDGVSIQINTNIISKYVLQRSIIVVIFPVNLPKVKFFTAVFYRIIAQCTLSRSLARSLALALSRSLALSLSLSLEKTEDTSKSAVATIDTREEILTEQNKIRTVSENDSTLNSLGSYIDDKFYNVSTKQIIHNLIQQNIIVDISRSDEESFKMVEVKNITHLYNNKNKTNSLETNTNIKNTVNKSTVNKINSIKDSDKNKINDLNANKTDYTNDSFNDIGDYINDKFYNVLQDMIKKEVSESIKNTIPNLVSLKTVNPLTTLKLATTIIHKTL